MTCLLQIWRVSPDIWHNRYQVECCQQKRSRRYNFKPWLVQNYAQILQRLSKWNIEKCLKPKQSRQEQPVLTWMFCFSWIAFTSPYITSTSVTSSCFIFTDQCVCVGEPVGVHSVVKSEMDSVKKIRSWFCSMRHKMESVCIVLLKPVSRDIY